MDHSRLLKSMIVNNDGVVLVKLGDYEGAIKAFTQSLEGLRPLLAVTARDAAAAATLEACDVVEKDGDEMESDLESSSSSEEDGDEEETQSLRKRRRGSLPSGAINPSRPTTGQCSEDSSSPECCGVTATQGGFHQEQQRQQQQQSCLDQRYIFSDPIEIPSEATKAAPTQSLCSKLSMVVMYNLALSFHLCALAQGCTARLTRARTLYELAFQMHLEESCEVTLLYSLALMNNLGLVYRLLNDSERSNQCFQHLLATMMFLLESEEAHKIKQWDGLMSNVLGLIFTDHAVAAAA